jgi:hypothetical protein
MRNLKIMSFRYRELVKNNYLQNLRLFILKLLHHWCGTEEISSGKFIPDSREPRMDWIPDPQQFYKL